MSDYRSIYREKEFTYKGFNCAINFRNLGFRTGYIEIPKDHALYGIDAILSGGDAEQKLSSIIAGILMMSNS